jgi:enterochelin esterase-like enzyme
LLLGGGALVLGGGALLAFEEHDRLQRWGHAAGVIGSPDRAIPKGDAAAVYGSFTSAAMQRSVRYGLYTPDGTVATTLVCLHGKGGSEHTAFDNIGIHRFVAERHLPIAVAAVAGGDDSYWHARSDGTDAGRMVVEEFVPLVKERTGATNVALLGWSMGGYGSLLAMARHPDLFAAVAVGSPAIWQRAGQTAPGAFDDAADFARNNLFSMTGPLRSAAIRVDCGNSDPFVPGVRAFLTAVPTATGQFRPGYHDDAFWRSVAPDQLDFLTAHVG